MIYYCLACNFKFDINDINGFNKFHLKSCKCFDNPFENFSSRFYSYKKIKILTLNCLKYRITINFRNIISNIEFLSRDADDEIGRLISFNLNKIVLPNELNSDLPNLINYL